MESTTGNKMRMLRSDIWEHFHYQPPSTAGGKDDKAICKLCGRTLSAPSPSGTLHLWRHIEKSCPESLASDPFVRFCNETYVYLEKNDPVDI